MKKNVGEYIIELRNEMGMTRQEFCDYFGIPYRTLQDWELGNRSMPEYVLRLLAYQVQYEKPKKEGNRVAEEKADKKKNIEEKPNTGIKTKDLTIFKSSDANVVMDVYVDRETVWLTSNQMARLFDRDEKTIRKHVNNVFDDNEVEYGANTQKMRVAGVSQPVNYYSLDVIISVGYRVKSQRGVEFRKWANSVLRQYILQGYAVNDTRLKELGEVIRLMKRAENDLDSKQVLIVVERYNKALEMLDAYDHQTMNRPKGNETLHVLNYDECRHLIDSMRFGNESDLFGKEKDGSFAGSIGNIYQSFGGVELYPTLEEKAANLLYFITKNHGFYDGNKRIAATMFLYFLDTNQALFNEDGSKRIDDHTLVALTIMIAESRPDEKEMMVTVIMNCLA